MLIPNAKMQAFKFAMIFANLRKGGGGRANMNAFVACMDEVWEKRPMHVVVNARLIMELGSAKTMLVLLKHFSNPALDHANNYWGNLAAIDARSVFFEKCLGRVALSPFIATCDIPLRVLGEQGSVARILGRNGDKAGEEEAPL
jgi:hypothetical protein